MILLEFFSPKSERLDFDQILAKCCEMVIDGQKDDPDYYGLVGACVVLPNGEEVYSTSYKNNNDHWVHAERAALDKCDDVEPGSIVVTTLSPCNRPMNDRAGESCTDLLQDYGINLDHVYCGYKDPTQEHDTVEETSNPKLRELCKQISDTFLKDTP